MEDAIGARQKQYQDSFAESVEALQNTAEIGADIGRLAVLESRLAINSLGRIIVLALLSLPLLLLAWLAVTLLPAVVLYAYVPSLPLGVAVFLSLQLLALCAIVRAMQVYARSLRFPLTSRQVREFLGRGADEA